MITNKIHGGLDMRNEQSQTFQLWWFDKEEKRHFPAGVAFYEEPYGEYRLKIDIHPNSQYYLKAISSIGSKASYQVDVVLKRNGKFKGRRPVGEGYSNELTKGDIIMNLGPYKRTLILGSEAND